MKMTPMKKIRNKLNGVLLLDKPLGLSSNQAIQRVKRLLNAEKVGHTGTLDPLASGLLPVCLGEATKFAGYLLDGDKEYLATAQLGVTTASGDAEGTVLTTTTVLTSQAAIEQALRKFSGPQWQTPPMYSALKHEGKPLYEYARQGITIERQPRQITIHQLELVAYDALAQQISLRIMVSKGTYIRTLAEDIGQELGCGAFLTALRRSSSNQFNLSKAITLEQLVAAEQQRPLLNCDVLVSHLAAYNLDQSEFQVLKYGNILSVAQAAMPLDQELRLYANQVFLGIGSFTQENEQLYLRPKRLVSGTADLQPWS